MNTSSLRQSGASTLVTLLVVLAAGYALLVGIQYVPQLMESRTLDSILASIETSHKAKPVSNTQEVKDQFARALTVNDMDDLGQYFLIRRTGDEYEITVNYERNLNLLYKKKPIRYEKSLTLSRH